MPTYFKLRVRKIIDYNLKGVVELKHTPRHTETQNLWKLFEIAAECCLWP